MPEQKDSPEGSKRVTQNQQAAITAADELSVKIVEEVHDVVGVILALRMKAKTFDEIAEDEKAADLLESIGAQTFEVRKAIAYRVCKATLLPALEESIIAKIRSRPRDRELTPAILQALKNGQEKSLHTWTPELDQTLVRLAETVVREKAPKKGFADWPKIAEIMKHDHNIELTPKQWMGRLGSIKTAQAEK